MRNNLLYIMTSIVLLFSILLTSCENDSSNGNSESGERTYVSWSNSENGEWVLDANNDFVRFDADTREMVLGDTVCPSLTLGDDGSIYHNGARIGRVAGWASSNEGTVVVMAGNNDNELIDIYGTAPNVGWQYHKISNDRKPQPTPYPPYYPPW